jgi:hypothetical protein
MQVAGLSAALSATEFLRTAELNGVGIARADSVFLEASVTDDQLSANAHRRVGKE